MPAPLNKRLGLSPDELCELIATLYLEEGFTHSRIADKLGCSVSAIETWASRAGIKHPSGSRHREFCNRGHRFVISTTSIDNRGWRSCKICEAKRKKAQAPVNRPRMKKNERKYHLRKTYGITEQDFDNLVKVQGGKCAICSTPFDSSDLSSTCNIDHDHSTGVVRGLLCRSCNHGLGHFRDNQGLLQSASEYLGGKRSLIFGIGGQDGHYLSALLVSRGYDVHGVVRRTSQRNPMLRILPSTVSLHDGDVTDFSSVLRLMSEIRPHEVYNLSAQSHVGISFKEPLHTTHVNYLGVVNILEAARLVRSHAFRIYQASTSEMFGGRHEGPCNENTDLRPRSPYAVAKVAAHHAVINYREAYGLFACNGILFNHESPVRPENFVTRKITMAVARISKGLQDKLYLGNLDAKRDWGFSGDYVRGMWLMLNQPQPDDYVLATGETHSVRDFCHAAFSYVDLNYEDYVEVDPKFYRPLEVDVLIGDYSKAKRELGWEPTTKFDEIVRKMVDYDISLLED